MERRLLQVIVALSGLFAVIVGFFGAAFGATFLNLSFSPAVDSYIRFLFGIILAIGLVLLASVPHIERHGSRFSVLTVILVIGGIARLFGVMSFGVPTQGVLAGLMLELIVSPLVWLWQRRIAHQCARHVID